MVRRDEAFEIDFYERVLKRTPTQIDALRQLGHLYTRTGRVREGLTVDLKLALLCPRDAVAQYNLACSYALLRDTERAIACLAEAVRLGYRDAAHLREDPDLTGIREDPRFAAILAGLDAPDSGAS